MKQKNLVKKALFPAIIALLCSFVALTSVSYAWFTMGSTATLQEMDLKVTTSEGLQISTTGDAGTYKSTISLTDLQADGTNNEFPAEVNPVSTIGKIVNGNQNMFKGSVTDGKLTSATAGEDYIVFDLYIQSSKEYGLIIDTDSYVKSANDKATEGTGQTHLASRVSFVDLGSAAKIADAKALGTDVDGTATIWEPNSTKRSTGAINQGDQSDGSNVAYKGLKATFNGILLEDLGDSETAEVSTIKDSDLATTPVVDLEAGYNKIRVYIWLEGQDVDCVNEIAGGTLKIKLNFKVIEVQKQ